MALRALLVLAGVAIVFGVLGSAVRTVILPRAVPARLPRMVFFVTRILFGVRIGRRTDYRRLDSILALYAPATLLVLLFVWLGLALLGYAAIYVGTGGTVTRALVLSGSALTTLGFTQPRSDVDAAIAISEGFVGLILLALLITYLPALYAAFQRREALVTMLEVRAGAPPWGVVMIERFTRLGRLERLSEEVWTRWEEWFVDVEESHTSLPALTFFRSPQPDHSWITAAGAVLDAASLYASTVDCPREVQAELTIRAGYLSLRRIAGSFDLPFDPDPRPDDPISVTRGEYDEACKRLEDAGVPLKADREQAWRDFAGWRVNYDDVLIGLSALVHAPDAPWSSDRAERARRFGFRTGR